MNKTLENARDFFKKPQQSEVVFKEGFENLGLIKKPTISIHISIDLTDKEQQAIQKILVDAYQPSSILESQVSLHVEQLINITKQIKNISAQSVLLHGERIKQAQELLSNYREGAFSKWLMNTYGNRQTPYSMLGYYEFHTKAPNDCKSLIESAPKKAVYLLASRIGDENKKFEIIQKHSTASQSDLLLLIQSAFPMQNPSRKKPLNTLTIESIEKLCIKLQSRSKHLSENDREGIKKLIERLQII